MSYTIMNMSALHIWGFERGDTEWRMARSAGWRRGDLAWERLMERANRHNAQGRPRHAARTFLVADLLARIWFPVGDPRRATAAGARARLADHSGNPGKAAVLASRAIREFAEVSAFIEDMEIKPRSRSSLFHLRMEALHRETYHDNLRVRLGKIADETRQTLAGILGQSQSSHRHYSRWKGEKPSIFDDTRKVLAACLLMPDS